MSYVLSERSLSRLEGINDKLSKVVQSAIDYTKVDFGVTCGLRTIAVPYTHLTLPTKVEV